ncbi:hypothetical protein BAZOLSSOX_749 [uncultured Gammaproteobacteria bacterium]|nr:hypothetical protein BAZOLSSOX_749 [uncultured Gammaproteobacteria bacterium]
MCVFLISIFGLGNYKRIHSVIGYITPVQNMAELKKVA